MEQKKINFIFVYFSEKCEQKVGDEHNLSGQLKILYYIVKKLDFFEARRLGSFKAIGGEIGLNRKTVKPMLEKMIVDRLIIHVSEEVREEGQSLHRLGNEYVLNDTYGYNSNIFFEKYFMDKRESMPDYHILKGYYEGIRHDRSSVSFISADSGEHIQIESEWQKDAKKLYVDIFNELIDDVVNTFKSLFENVEDLNVECARYTVEMAIVNDCNLRRQAFDLFGDIYSYENNNEYNEILKREQKDPAQVLFSDILQDLGFKDIINGNLEHY